MVIEMSKFVLDDKYIKVILYALKDKIESLADIKVLDAASNGESKLENI